MTRTLTKEEGRRAAAELRQMSQAIDLAEQYAEMEGQPYGIVKCKGLWLTLPVEGETRNCAWPFRTDWGWTI